MSTDKNITDMPDWMPMVVDLANTPDVTVDLSHVIDKCDQLWLTGYYADALSTPFIRIECKGGAGSLFQETIAVGADSGGAGIFIAEPGTGAAAVRRDLATPMPVLNPDHNLHRVPRLTFRVRSFTDAAVTFTRLILFFAVSRNQRVTNPIKRMNRLAHDAMNQASSCFIFFYFHPDSVNVSFNLRLFIVRC